jgi:hypothetical protein
MRVLGSIVTQSTTFMSFCYSKITGSGSIRSQIVYDQLVRDKSVLLQKLAHEFHRGTLVPPALDQHIKHFALGIHGTPQIHHAAGDFQIDLVKMPGSVALRSTFAQFHRDHGPEMIHPTPYGLVGNHDAPFSATAFSRFSGLATMPLTASGVYRPWVI